MSLVGPSQVHIIHCRLVQFVSVCVCTTLFYFILCYIIPYTLFLWDIYFINDNIITIEDVLSQSRASTVDIICKVSKGVFSHMKFGL